MNEWAILKDWLPAINTPLLLFLTWLVGRIYINHLPHIFERLGELKEGLSRLEGVKSGVELERMRKP